MTAGRVAAAVVLAAAAAACVGHPMPKPSEVRTPVDRTVFEQMRTKRFFFAHRSVGLNIIEGVQGILAASPGAPLRVAETSDPAQIQPGVLAHANIGRNGDPYSKMAAFKADLDGGIGARADVALFKFCYLDVDESTDIQAVFRRYSELIDEIGARYPSLHLVIVTVPLQQVQAGPKAWVKQLIGRLPDAYAADARREEFNALLRARYAQHGNFFDLAALEASTGDGPPHTYTIDGRRVIALAPEFAADEGHLNEIASRSIAAKFLAVLARAATPQQTARLDN